MPRCVSATHVFGVVSAESCVRVRHPPFHCDWGTSFARRTASRGRGRAANRRRRKMGYLEWQGWPQSGGLGGRPNIDALADALGDRVIETLRERLADAIRQ